MILVSYLAFDVVEAAAAEVGRRGWNRLWDASIEGERLTGGIRRRVGEGARTLKSERI